MKALEILKKKLLLISKSSEVHQQYVDAIAELEALLEPRTCDGCTYFTECLDSFNYCNKTPYLNGFVNKSFGCINYEAKAQQ
jgi:hypothetical protein